MVKSLGGQIKSLQERQTQLKTRGSDLMTRHRERERRTCTKRLTEVGTIAESAAGFEGGDEGAGERITRFMQPSSLVEAMRFTDVMDSHMGRENLKATVTKALERDIRASDGISQSLRDLVYEAPSEGWGRRDDKISNLWADDEPSGYQSPLCEPVSPERKTPQTPPDGLIQHPERGAVRPS